MLGDSRPPQRLVFGAVAEAYDRFRPTYPERLIDDLVEVARLDGTAAVLEVGTGTGKATMLFAARGIPVIGIEPSAEMTAVARRNMARFAQVEIEESDFERWEARGRRFPLIFSAQAWHWVEPEPGFAKAWQVLAPGGWLAAFWNRFAWDKSDLRQELTEAYRRAAPDLRRAGGMHPGDPNPYKDEDWEEDVARMEGFGAPEVRVYEWDRTYSTREYVGLLATASDVRLLDDGTRSALCAAAAEVIDAHGGSAVMRMRTRLCLARRH